jgi:hypothetical protein
MNYLDKLKIAITKKEFWDNYLPLLAKSIKVTPCAHLKYKDWEGVGIPRDGYPWASRANRWKRLDVYWYSGTLKELKTSKECDIFTDMPLFPNYVKKAMAGVALTSDPLDLSYTHLIYNGGVDWNTFKTNEQENKMKDKLQNTANAVLDQNKIAAKLAAKLSAGKTANHFFLSKLAGKLPWYAKFFGKKNELQDNPVAS